MNELETALIVQVRKQCDLVKQRNRLKEELDACEKDLRVSQEREREIRAQLGYTGFGTV